jgi:hypothetical protein
VSARAPVEANVQAQRLVWEILNARQPWDIDDEIERLPKAMDCSR